MAHISMEKVGKVYPDGTRAVGDVNIEIEDGEFLVLVGLLDAESRRCCAWWLVLRRSLMAP